MVDPDVRARLLGSANEYDRIAEIAARSGDIGTSADARQSASDIRRMMLAAEDEAPADRPSYGQLMATAVQHERLLILLILQAKGELRLSSESTLLNGEAVIHQRYRVVHRTDEDSGDFVLTVEKREAGLMAETWTDADGSFNQTVYLRSRARWTAKIWQGAQADLFPGADAIDKGRKFENIALQAIFPRLSITNAVALAPLAAHAPFDFLADLAGERVAIEVSSKWQKRVGDKWRLADAFRLPLYTLLISPRDPGFYFFTPIRPHAKSIRVPIELLKTMATALGEARHG